MLGRYLLLVLVAFFVSSCGSSSPTTPSSSPPVSGAWIGHSTLTSVSGGECVGSTLAAAVGSRDIFSARIQQNDSELAASLTYQGNRTSCMYRGNTANGAVNLNFSACPAGRIETFVCSNGDVRQLEIVGTRVSAQNSGTTGTGTDTTTLNVHAAGRSAPVGVLTVSSEFRWNVLGIPHNDFHIFDGSILPGYVDGLIIIPEDMTPFCTKCGWFGQ
jgi:hypothetical protein